MTAFLLSGYQDVLNDDLIVGTLEEELRNAWSISLSPEQFSEITEADFVQFIRLVIAAREAKAPPDHSMWFYCWVDEQAGQFRFGIVSVRYELPFGCEVKLVTDLDLVVQKFFASPYTAGIPVDELTEVDPNLSPIDPPELPFVLDVWKQRLPADR